MRFFMILNFILLAGRIALAQDLVNEPPLELGNPSAEPIKIERKLDPPPGLEEPKKKKLPRKKPSAKSATSSTSTSTSSSLPSLTPPESFPAKSATSAPKTVKKSAPIDPKSSIRSLSKGAVKKKVKPQGAFSDFGEDEKDVIESEKATAQKPLPGQKSLPSNSAGKDSLAPPPRDSLAPPPRESLNRGQRLSREEARRRYMEKRRMAQHVGPSMMTEQNPMVRSSSLLTFRFANIWAVRDGTNSGSFILNWDPVFYRRGRLNVGGSIGATQFESEAVQGHAAASFLVYEYGASVSYLLSRLYLPEIFLGAQTWGEESKSSTNLLLAANLNLMIKKGTLGNLDRMYIGYGALSMNSGMTSVYRVGVGFRF